MIIKINENEKEIARNFLKRFWQTENYDWYFMEDALHSNHNKTCQSFIYVNLELFLDDYRFYQKLILEHIDNENKNK